MASRLVTAVASCASTPRTTSPCSPPTAMLELLGPRPRCGCGRRPRRCTVSTSTGTSSGSGSPPCSRDRSISSRTSRPSRSASCAIRPAKRCTASGSSAALLDRLGEQRQRADRRLQLVPDVGDEVAADRLRPPGLGDVLQHQRDRPGRRHRCRCPAGRRARRPAAGRRRPGPRAAATSARRLPPSRTPVRQRRAGPGTSSRVPRTMPSARAAGLASSTASSASDQHDGGVHQVHAAAGPAPPRAAPTAAGRRRRRRRDGRSGAGRRRPPPRRGGGRPPGRPADSRPDARSCAAPDRPLPASAPPGAGQCSPGRGPPFTRDAAGRAAPCARHYAVGTDGDRRGGRHRAGELPRRTRRHPGAAWWRWRTRSARR